jgi:hypothetical protein
VQLEGAYVSRADKYNLGRAPTTAQKWLGVVLSAFITIVCFGILVISVIVPTHDATQRSTELAVQALFGILGSAGLFFFYRATFTKPGTTTPKAQRIFALFCVAVSVATVAGSLLTNTPAEAKIRSVILLFVAIGYLSHTTPKRAQANDLEDIS